LIALVDTYQSLISTRPYRKKLRKEEAIKELQNEAGKKFDPKLVQDFLQILL
jgi:HD-GYP domain-containing protein (c-di-GMP phosphodiesterase class II)